MTQDEKTNLSFRPALRQDLAAIVALLADDHLGKTRERPGLPLDPAYFPAFEAIDRDPNQLLAIAERAEELVGCLQITFIPGLSHMGVWRGQIESVRIASSCRGEGLGGVMFRWAIGQCRARGCGLVQLTTDKNRLDALRFYEDLGFEASHEGLKLSL
jgi:ribosomal protein S18 acetylase RimI-like enzyme